MQTSVTQRDTGTREKKRVFRRPFRAAVLCIEAAFTVGCSGYAVYGFLMGYASFRGHAPGASAVFAVGSAIAMINDWRQGLYIEDVGVRVVRPYRPGALSVKWNDIARFEMRTTAGQRPVNLIRTSNQRTIAVPTFPRPRKDLDRPDLARLRARVQGQVDELNALLDARRPDEVPIVPA